MTYIEVRTSQVRLAVADAYRRLLSRSLETEMRLATKQRADGEAIRQLADARMRIDKKESETQVAEAATMDTRDGTPAISAEDLRFSYGDQEAVKGISFEIAPGEIFGFLGPNGAGKTTTINTIYIEITITGFPPPDGNNG